jgi:hypothetical protein
VQRIWPEIVDSACIRYGEAGVGGNQCIEINQHAAAVDEAEVLGKEKILKTFVFGCFLCLPGLNGW